MDGRTLTVAVSKEAQHQSVRAHETPWESLCAASLLKVYYLLESKDVAACSCVCRTWRDVGQTSRLWRDLLVREVGCPLRQFEVSKSDEKYRQMLVDAKTARLWSWGANVLKLAGISADSIHLPTEVFLHAIEVGPSVSGIAFSAESHTELRNLPAREVSCAEDFAVILTWEGQVIDSRGSLANNAPWRHQGRSLAPLSEWPFSEEANQVVAVAAGGTWSGHDVSGGHAAAITADGGLWVWGGNAQGQLGLGEESEAWVSLPRRVGKLDGQELPAPAAAVACGASHTAVLLADGTLWVAGNNYLGACGLPDSVPGVRSYTHVDLNSRTCSQLAAGDYNTAVLTSSGRVMVCGSNQSSQCGMPSAIPCSHAFLDLGPNTGWHGAMRGTELQFEIVGVACGSGSIYALEKGGSAFAWGGGANGELGIRAVTHAVATPSRMLWANDVEYLTGSAAGGKFGAAIDAHGRLYTFGNGRAGQLGHGDTSKRSVGRVVKTLQPVVVRRAAAGACFSMAISSWRCPSSVSPPETPEPTVTPSILSPVTSSVFKDMEDTDSNCTHFSSLSLRPSVGLGHLHTLHRNSSAASWNSDCSDGMSMYTSSPGDTEDDEDDDDSFMADDAPDADLGRQDYMAARSSSFPGAVNRLNVQGYCHRFMGAAGGSVQNLISSAIHEDHEQQAQANNDRQLRRDLRRQLRKFMQDSTKRELLFPPTLNSAERHQVHVVADAWGLCHQSRGQPPERQLVVWKPSKAIRRSSSALAAQAELAPPLLERDEDMDHEGGSDSDVEHS